MATNRVTLDGTSLPLQFSYAIPSPKKRNSVRQTAGGTVVQLDTTLHPGDSVIAWKCEAATRAEWHWFLTKFRAGGTLAFVGYWGDVMTVRFLAMDDPEVRAGTIFNLSGSFQIISVTSWGTAS